MTKTAFQTYFFVALFLLVLVVVYLIFSPFLNVLLLAAVFAVALDPLRASLVRRFSLGPRLAAALVILFATIAILTIVSFLTTQVFTQARDLYLRLQVGDTSLEQLQALIQDYVQRLIPNFQINIGNYIREATSWVVSQLGPIFSGTLGVILKLFIWVLAFYYFLKDGRRFIETLVHLSPLNSERDWEIIAQVQSTINTVIRGSLLVAVIQGLLAGIGLAIFGVPNAVLWGTLAAFAALIPSLGTSLINIPAVIYLLSIGRVGAAIGLLAWALLVVGLVDNLLAPYIYSRGGPIHPLLMLVGVLGRDRFLRSSRIYLGAGYFEPLLRAAGHLSSRLGREASGRLTASSFV